MMSELHVEELPELQCRVCGCRKPAAEFVKDPRRPLGRSSECHECKAKRRRETPRSEREMARQRTYMHDRWEREGPALAARRRSRALSSAEPQAAMARSRERTYWGSKKWIARQALRNAVAKGRIIKPTICDGCGTCALKPLHGHHADYDRPLDVLWLCTHCHGRMHRKDTPQR
jgi:hypothetical protein